MIEYKQKSWIPKLELIRKMIINEKNCYFVFLCLVRILRVITCLGTLIQPNLINYNSHKSKL